MQRSPLHAFAIAILLSPCALAPARADDDPQGEAAKPSPKSAGPKSPAEQKIEAALNLRKLGKFDEALAALKEVAAPGNPAKVRADALYRTGETWFRKGQDASEEKLPGVASEPCFREAIKVLSDAVKELPQEETTPDCVYLTGSSYLMLNELDKAMVEYGKAYSNYPKFDRRSTALTRIAVCQAGLDDARGAQTTLLRVLREFPAQPAPDQNKVRKVLNELQLVGLPAPPIQASKWIDGLVGPEGLKTFDGEVIVLVFFATWCTHCKAELPRMRSLIRTWSAKGVTFLGVNDPEDPKSVEPVGVYVKKHDLPFLDVALDVGARSNMAYRVQGFPAGVIIDRKGRVRWRGHMTFFPTQLLAKALAEK